MVSNNQIASIERKAMLHKSGLIKPKDDRWKDTEGAILKMNYDSNKEQ